MLFGDFVRSPYAHARIKRIDTSKAQALPGVLAVLTAEELKPRQPRTGCRRWRGDVQAVLADGKVLFQNQEVAFVVAEDRYAAADGVELVEVEYEELPAIVDPFKAMARRRAGAARGHRGQDRRRPRPAQAPQPHLQLGGGRQGRRPTPPSPRPR